MQSKELQKIIYKDDKVTKAITCKILKEDDFFIYILAVRTNREMRIGKNSVVAIKPISDQTGGY